MPADEDSTPPLSKSNILKPNFRQRKARKTGLTTIELQRMFPELAETATGQDRPVGYAYVRNDWIIIGFHVLFPYSSVCLYFFF